MHDHTKISINDEWLRPSTFQWASAELHLNSKLGGLAPQLSQSWPGSCRRMRFKGCRVPGSFFFDMVALPRSLPILPPALRHQGFCPEKAHCPSHVGQADKVIALFLSHVPCCWNLTRPLEGPGGCKGSRPAGAQGQDSLLPFCRFGVLLFPALAQSFGNNASAAPTQRAAVVCRKRTWSNNGNGATVGILSSIVRPGIFEFPHPACPGEVQTMSITLSRPVRTMWARYRPRMSNTHTFCVSAKH